MFSSVLGEIIAYSIFFFFDGGLCCMNLKEFKFVSEFLARLFEAVLVRELIKSLLLRQSRSLIDSISAEFLVRLRGMPYL